MFNRVAICTSNYHAAAKETAEGRPEIRSEMCYCFWRTAHSENDQRTGHEFDRTRETYEPIETCQS